MPYKWKYETPSGFSTIHMNSDGEYITGLWFDGSRDENKHSLNCDEKKLEIFKETSRWLDIYFSGKNPDFIPKYKINNLTPFRASVINIMNSIPYGKVITYNDIAKKIAKFIKKANFTIKISSFSQSNEKIFSSAFFYPYYP